MRYRPRYRRRNDYTREVLFFCLGICACVIAGLAIALVLALTNSGGPLLGGEFFADKSDAAENLEQLDYDEGPGQQGKGKNMKVDALGSIDELANAEEEVDDRQVQANVDDPISKIDDPGPIRKRGKKSRPSNRVGDFAVNPRAKTPQSDKKQTVPDRKDTQVEAQAIPKPKAHTKSSGPAGK